MARILWAALCVAVFACVYTFPVRANEPQVGTGLVCDTKEQVALFASLVEEKGKDSALAAVNEDAGSPAACVVASVLYVVVEKMDSVKIGAGSYRIAKILVGGVRTPAGLVPIAPKEYFTLFVDDAGRPA